MRVRVRHAGVTHEVSLLDTEITMGQFQLILEKQTGVPCDKQRIVCGGKVCAVSRDSKLPDSICRGPVLLIGSPENDHLLRDVAQAKAVLCVPRETDEGWFQCSYAQGYIAQTCFVCRSCTDNGDALPAHVICAACLNVCHAGHHVELWGTRLHTRCDCCTVAFNGPSHHCQFIVDEESLLVPPQKLPRNTKNRYPLDTSRWCFCKQTTEGAEDDEQDVGGGRGQSCIICNHCFWLSHLTSIHTMSLSLMSCYGDVSSGDLLAFECITCQKAVCWPCRYRCHKNHEFSKKPIVWRTHEPQPDDGETESEDDEFTVQYGPFECGCLGQCGIAEAVMPNADPMNPIEPEVGSFLLLADDFVRFICGHCMQEHGSWLLPEMSGRKFGECWEGLDINPAPVKRKVLCKWMRDNAPGDPCDSYLWHGMVISESFFSQLCQCESCRASFERLLPGITEREVPAPLFSSKSRECSNCRKQFFAEEGYLCSTCALDPLANEYQLCGKCYEMRNSSLNPVHSLSHKFLLDTPDNLYDMLGAALVGQVDANTQRWMVEHWDDSKDTVRALLSATFGVRRIEVESQDRNADAASLESRRRPREEEDEISQLKSRKTETP